MQRLKYQTFTSNSSWTSPPGISNAILFGRGGSAGGSGTDGSNGGASQIAPGGGGVYSIMMIVSVVPNTSYSITIGTAGAGGTGGAGTVGLGTGGGDTSFGSLATFRGASVGHDDSQPSQGLTFGGVGNFSGGHALNAGQRSPFAVGGIGASFVSSSHTNYLGGGGGGDGAGGAASGSTTGTAGTNGGGGGSGKNTGGAGTIGNLVVAWIE